MFGRSHGCPVTRRLYHQFDAVSHRCACGRWERGYAHKKEPVRPRDECQICERKQAMDASGRLMAHGYRRPGIGFIVGSCYGCGSAPYPATDALERYRKALCAHIDALTQALLALLDVAELPYTYEVRRKESVTIVVKRGEERGEYVDNMSRRVPSFASLETRERNRLQGEVGATRAELERVEKRIAKATAE